MMLGKVFKALKCFLSPRLYMFTTGDVMETIQRALLWNWCCLGARSSFIISILIACRLKLSWYGMNTIMVYGSMPYVGMTPKKNGGHIKSAQMTHSKCLG